jgi:hypothetical protein
VLLNVLKKSEMLAVDGIQCESFLFSRQEGSRFLGSQLNHVHGFTALSTHPKLSIGFDDAGYPVDRLVVRVSSDKEERELALFTALPRLLMEWLMADPKTQKRGTVTVLGVSLMKSVLTAPPNVIDSLLTREGVGRIRIIEVSLKTTLLEAKLQDTTSNEPASQPSQNRYDSNTCSNLLIVAHKNKSEEAPPANASTKKSEKTLGKQPATPVTANKQPHPVAGPSSSRASREPTPQADQPQSTPEEHPESSSSGAKTPHQNEPVLLMGEGRYKPLYASIS